VYPILVDLSRVPYLPAFVQLLPFAAHDIGLEGCSGASSQRARMSADRLAQDLGVPIRPHHWHPDGRRGVTAEVALRPVFRQQPTVLAGVAELVRP
jgi:hypothetical protein